MCYMHALSAYIVYDRPSQVFHLDIEASTHYVMELLGPTPTTVG